MARKEKDSTFPAPTAHDPERPAGRDFLGQLSVIQDFAGRCLPSLTNRTRRARYYLFWAWAFTKLEEYIDELRTHELKQRYLFKLETALIISNIGRNPDLTGLAGIDGIEHNRKDIANFKDNQKVSLNSRQKRATSYSPAEYRPSLGYLNVVEFEGKRIIMRRYGKELGRIFDQRAKMCDGYETLVDPRRQEISWKLLKSLEEVLSIDKISASERTALIMLIEQNEISSNSTSTSPRIHTTLLILDLIRKKKITGVRKIFDPVWHGKYNPPAMLENITGAWRVVEARRYYQFAVEGILASFCRFLESRQRYTGTFLAFADQVIKNFSDEVFAGLPKLKDVVKTNMPFEKFVQAIDGATSALDEWALVENAKEAHNDEVPLKAFICANHSVILLILLCRKYEFLRNGNSRLAGLFLDEPRGFKHSLTMVRDYIKQWELLPTQEALKNIIIQFSLSLHLSVSQDKWMQTGNFTFRFVHADDGGYKFRKFRKRMKPNMTGNKIYSYMQILNDIGLWKMNGDRLVLTEAGEAYLKKYDL